jgi:tRNA-binding protein
MLASFDDFQRLDIRVGKVIEAEELPQARKPAYKLIIDFGPEMGRKKSSAQITKHYSCEDLVGRLVMGVVNFEPKQIGPFVSEALTLGFADEDGDVVLARPDKDVPVGTKLF